MYWLYFMRDFYRAASAPRTQLRAQIAAVVYAPLQTKAHEAPASKHTSPIDSRGATASPIHNYLQRLSVEGEHAFGVWNAAAGFSLFSANFERVTGLSSGDCAGHDWIHAVHHHQQYNLHEALHGALAGHDGHCLIQARSAADDGWRWLLVDIKAANDAGEVMVLWRDTTEQKALDEALKQTQAALALSERGRASFLSGMSHELRTPLNAIMGFAEMMKEGVLGPVEHPTYRDYVHHIHDSGASLLGKINALLEMANIDTGRLTLDEEEFPLSELLAELSEIHSHAAFNREQRLIIDCPGSFHLLADRAKLLCALSHLTTNALRHSPDGATVTVQVRIQPGDGLVLSVRDHGEGIANAQLTAIREALVAPTGAITVETSGIGLGLSLTRELIARHDGRVSIDSIRQRGTVAALVLPLARVTQGLPRKRNAEHRLQLVE